MHPWAQSMELPGSAFRHQSPPLLLALLMALPLAATGTPLILPLSHSWTDAALRGVSTTERAGGFEGGKNGAVQGMQALHGASVAEALEATVKGRARRGGSQREGETVRVRNLWDGAVSGPEVASEARREAQILLRFKRTVTRDPNGALDTWRPSSQSPCSWGGVTCKQGRVARLNLTAQRIVGKIGFGYPGFGGLRALEGFSLSGNNLRGALPWTLSLATKLQSVSLADNGRVSGSIPSAYGRLRNLKLLNLRNCNISGSLPGSLGSLTALRRINLAQNSLSGPLPRSLSRLTSLFLVRLDQNRLTGPLDPLLGPSHPAQGVHPPPPVSPGAPLFPLGVPPGSPTTTQQKQVGAVSRHARGLQAKETRGFPLTSLNVASNNFSGPIPWGLGLRTNLLSLSLSSNSLSGPLPGTLSRLRVLQLLRARRNSLGSTLPGALNSLTALRLLDLAFNRFQGSLPLNLEALSGLAYLNVSHNMLSGTVLASGNLAKFPSSSFVENPSLCFHTCPPPPPASFPPPHPPPPATQFPPPHPPTPPPPPRQITVQASPPAGLSGGAIAGLVVSALVALVLLAALLTTCFWTSRFSHPGGVLAPLADSGQSRESGMTGVTGVTSKPSLPSTGEYADLGASNLLTMFDDTKSLGLADVLAATGGLGEDPKGPRGGPSASRLVGSGTTGAVFKAQMPDGRCLAVKKLHPPPPDGAIIPVIFEEEAAVLASLRHENVLPLLGYWAQGDLTLLLYEWMPQGNVHTAIHAVRDPDWPRLQVALGIARGLRYLHHSCEPPTVHGSLHPRNVLLDERGEPQVGEAGGLRLALGNAGGVPVAAESAAYRAPELGVNREPDTKSDVYSFGVLLFEMLSGKDAMDPVLEESEELSFTAWARLRIEDEDMDGFLDPCIVRSSGEDDDMLRAAQVALRCTAQDPDRRPSMLQVVDVLSGSRGWE